MIGFGDYLTNSYMQYLDADINSITLGWGSSAQAKVRNAALLYPSGQVLMSSLFSLSLPNTTTQFSIIGIPQSYHSIAIEGGFQSFGAVHSEHYVREYMAALYVQASVDSGVTWLAGSEYYSGSYGQHREVIAGTFTANSDVAPYYGIYNVSSIINSSLSVYDVYKTFTATSTGAPMLVFDNQWLGPHKFRVEFKRYNDRTLIIPTFYSELTGHINSGGQQYLLYHGDGSSYYPSDTTSSFRMFGRGQSINTNFNALRVTVMSKHLFNAQLRLSATFASSLGIYTDAIP